MNTQSKRKGIPAEKADQSLLDRIKQTAIVAMFSDDELMELVVLKGGNALDMIFQANVRSSVDLDFSLKDDLDRDRVFPRIVRALTTTFEGQGYRAFDITMAPRPGVMPTALASFWGGYLISFKLISLKRAREVEEDIDTMRREAVLLGEGSKFTIDVSRHEYIEDKQAHDLSGYQVFVYSPEMIVCEKIRAICQQMPEYAAIIQRKGLGNQRARDFVDIEALIRKFKIDLGSERADAILKAMFDIKHVPLSLIGKIPQTRDFHALGFDSVKATMKPNEEVQPFDYYFDFVVREIHKLKPLGDV